MFNHPGGEHVPRAGLENYPWNTNDHLRKFLLVSAKLARFDSKSTRYEIDGQPRNVALWGEWEPCSITGRFPPLGEKSLPKAWHRPVLGGAPPENAKDTDPWIFGSPMRYSNCRQARNPVLRTLQVGDLILFGSVKKKPSDRKFDFYLDTVFVVASSHGYNKSPNLQIPEAARMDAVYRHHGLERLGHSFPKGGHVLYGGASVGWDDGRGIFSWVPCKEWQGDPASARFARPMINDMFDVAFVHPMQGLLEVKEKPEIAWEMIAERCRDNGLEMAAQVLTPETAISQ